MCYSSESLVWSHSLKDLRKKAVRGIYFVDSTINDWLISSGNLSEEKERISLALSQFESYPLSFWEEHHDILILESDFKSLFFLSSSASTILLSG